MESKPTQQLGWQVQSDFKRRGKAGGGKGVHLIARLELDLATNGAGQLHKRKCQQTGLREDIEPTLFDLDLEIFHRVPLQSAFLYENGDLILRSKRHTTYGGEGGGEGKGGNQVVMGGEQQL